MKLFLARITLILIACFLHAYLCKAGTVGDLNGRVIEKETNTPVAFAQIVFDNGNEKITLTANEYGYYSAFKLPAGKYNVSVSFNNRTFVMNKIRIQDSLTSSVNLTVSSDNALPSTVHVEVASKDESSDPFKEVRLFNKPLDAYKTA